LQEALPFFEKSGRYNHAVRLAKQSGSEAELMQLALQASKSVMLDAARHFEAAGQPERAVQLYHKAGAVDKAIELSFASELFDDLRSITDELGEKTDPAVSTVLPFVLEVVAQVIIRSTTNLRIRSTCSCSVVVRTFS
jgi:intraflagellar transport protein 140